MCFVIGVPVHSYYIPGRVDPLSLGKNRAREIYLAIADAPLCKVSMRLAFSIRVVANHPAFLIYSPVHAHRRIRKIIRDVLAISYQKAVHHACLIKPAAHNIAALVYAMSERTGESEGRIKHSEIPIVAQ